MTTAAAYSCKTDRSPDTGSLVVCTCGLALGPFMEHERAAEVARDHRKMHAQHAQSDALGRRPAQKKG